MSMLIRTGTLVRKNTRKSSVRRTKSTGSTASSGSYARPPDEVERHYAVSSVPPSPVAKIHNLYTDQSVNNSPGKSSIITASTVVSFDDSSLSYKTSTNKPSSGATVRHGTSLQIEDANSEADNICEFFCTASQIIYSSAFVTSAVAVTVIVPLVMISFGVKHLDECPLEPRIPIFLIVGGCFGVVKLGLTLGKSIQNRRQGSIDNLPRTIEGGVNSRTYRSMDIILTLFLLVWHVLGTYWVLRIWKPRFKPLLHRPDQWCERSLYFFSVTVVVSVYAVLALIVLGMACLAYVYRSHGSRRNRRGTG